MYTFIKIFLRQIYSYNFYIFKLNNLRVIYDLYSQDLTQTLSKTTIILSMERVHEYNSLLPNLMLLLPKEIKILRQIHSKQGQTDECTKESYLPESITLYTY